MKLKGKIDPVKHLQGRLGVNMGAYIPPPEYIYPELQEKTVTPTAEEQRVTPDDGVYGMSAVLVKGVTLQAKSVQATKEDQNVLPDSGYVGMSIVEVKGYEDIDPTETALNESGDYITIALEDGSSVTVGFTFDAEGNPTSAMDTNGNSVEFSGGYPTMATLNDGHTVIISRTGARSSLPEPIAYLYNGFRASALPERNKELYPYEYISGLNPTHFIILSTEPYLYEGTHILTGEPTYRMKIREDTTAPRWYLNEAGEWERVTDESFTTSSSLNIPTWSNFDLIKENGTVHLAASDPVPVYE